LLSLVRSTRALQDCSDRVLAEPDMAADQPVAQTSLCQLEDLRRLAVRWTLSWLAAEPLTAGLGGGDAGLDALADKVPPPISRPTCACARAREASVRPKSIADICLVTQVTPAKTFNLSLDPYPRVMRIYDTCMAIPAFADAHAAKQPDAERG